MKKRAGKVEEREKKHFKVYFNGSLKKNQSDDIFKVKARCLRNDVRVGGGAHRETI